MQMLDLILIVKHIPLSIIFCLLPIFIILKHKKLQFTKLSFVILVITCGFMTEAVSVLHEVGHILVANLYNIKVVNLNCTLLYYSVTLAPPIYEADGFTQTAISIAGPAVSSITALLTLLATRIFKSKFIKIVFIYLFYVSMLGGVFSLFLAFSGDAPNFFQGLAKISGVGLTPMAFLSVILSATIVILTLIKVCQMIGEL